MKYDRQGKEKGGGVFVEMSNVLKSTIGADSNEIFSKKNQNT